ncbi:hypothetical protein AWC38_SpisGene5825 [Stylophora pistillata]|uniref:Uncharacterized protein n=1 Tax=Stylophora pistillata TaxID=50429 RepID=A0A2B4SJY6_STYPI|nr:hypothetical protein AWC38_SpisGene5825 [Stylophora pistillata]
MCGGPASITMWSKQCEIAMPAKQIAVRVQRKSAIPGSGPHDLGRGYMSTSPVRLKLRSLAGSKVVDTEPMAEIPFDDAYPEVIPVRPPEAPPIESSDSQADYNHVVPPRPQGSPNLVPVSATEAPDLSAVPPPQMPSVSRTEEPAKVTEEAAKVQVRKRYPTRLRSKPKRLIEEM